MDGNLRFKIDCASIELEGDLPFWLCFTLYLYFVFWRGNLTEGFFALPVWGAYIWKGLYMEGLIFGILR